MWQTRDAKIMRPDKLFTSRSYRCNLHEKNLQSLRVVVMHRKAQNHLTRMRGSRVWTVCEFRSEHFNTYVAKVINSISGKESAHPGNNGLPHDFCLEVFFW